MQTKYPYKILSSYPHMKPADVLIWERFINAFPNAYDYVFYDTNVGEGRCDVQHDDPSMIKSWGVNKARKIDVCGFKDDIVDIIEVKPHGGPSAAGQIWGYEQLYLDYIDPFANTRPVLLTDSYENDMRRLAPILGLVLIVV